MERSAVPPEPRSEAPNLTDFFGTLQALGHVWARTKLAVQRLRGADGA
jgi:hypothetical protein